MRKLNGPSKRLIFAHYAVLAAVVSGILWFAWTGFLASDDEYYAQAGLGWLHNFPYVADHFGRARYVIGIPVALMIGLFGEREFTVVLSTSIFLAATGALTLNMLSRLVGAVPALIMGSTMVTLPLLALKSTSPCADVPELFFVASSFWLFWIACQREQRTALLISAGAGAALAFSAHEIAVALLLFYGILFLTGHGIPRREYWLMAIGFLGVIAIECIYYAILTGNPLHRFSLLLAGAAIVDRIPVEFGQVAAGGTLHVWAPIDPLVMLFLKHEFSLLGFAAVPALWWAWIAKRSDKSPAILAARLLGGLGFVWFMVTAVVLSNMRLLPRYYMVTTYCLFIVAALWTWLEIWPKSRRLAVSGWVLFIIVNLVAIYIDNRNPRFGERALIEYLGTSTGPVYTDPMTAEDAHWFCRWAKADCSRIIPAPPMPGHIYFFNPKNADRPNRFVPAERMHLYQPRDGWREIWRKDQPQKQTGVVAEMLGLSSLLPQTLMTKLSRPNPTVRALEVTQ